MSDGDLPYLPYGRQSFGEEEVRAVVEVLRGDWLTQGPRIEAFEEKLCEITGAQHAVAVSSGTAALHLACLAFGLGEGDCALTTPLTFAATSNAVLYTGARPHFVDIDPRTWTLDPVRLEAALDSGTLPGRAKAILPVHFAGLPAELTAYREIARRRQLVVIEDACHALGSEWRDEDGAWHTTGDGEAADASVLSFHPVKHVATGEGGAVLTPHAEIARTIRRLRHHGIERDPERLGCCPAAWYHEMQELGFNYRLTDIQCALGLTQLGKLGSFVEKRREIATWYRELLAADSRVAVQVLAPNARSSWHLFAVRVPRRDKVFEAMRARQIGVQVHYIPVYRHPYYRDLGYAQDACPATDACADEILSLPLYPALQKEDVVRVVRSLSESIDEALR